MNIFARLCLTLTFFISQSALATNGREAEFISQAVPNGMEAGKSYSVSVTVKNTGTSTWSAGENYRLGFQADPTPSMKNSSGVRNDWFWGNPRVELTQNVAQDQTYTFSFTVTAPLTQSTTAEPFYNFRWQMLREGVEWFGQYSENVPIYVQTVATVNRGSVIAPVPMPADAFSFAKYRGVNVMHTSTQWTPTASQMTTIANSAVGMGLNVIRLTFIVPQNQNGVDATVLSARQAMDVANDYGLKVIVTLAGFLGKSVSYDCNQYTTFDGLGVYAGKFVEEIAKHPAIFAWDITNEPMWTARNFKRLANPTVSCLNSTADFQHVYDGVRAMYELVRAKDPNRPTTVGEMGIPYMTYWSAMSSFASPHVYPHLPSMVASNSFSSQTQLLNSMKAIVKANIVQAKNVLGSTPLVVGEWGFPLADFGCQAGVSSPACNGGFPSEAQNEASQAAAFRQYFQVLSEKNVGGAIWNASLDDQSFAYPLVPGVEQASQKNFSIIRPSGEWTPAGAAVDEQYPTGTQNSAFVSQQVPVSMAKGQKYIVSVTLRNSGTATWAKATNYKLASMNPNGNWIWGTQGRVIIKSPVWPNEESKIEFEVTAPQTPGSYNFQWQMLQEGVAFFGVVTPNVVVNVY